MRSDHTVRRREDTQTRTHANTHTHIQKAPAHTHIPTEAHIFCETSSYSVILQSGSRRRLRPPETWNQHMGGGQWVTAGSIHRATGYWPVVTGHGLNPTLRPRRPHTHLAMESHRPRLSTDSLRRSSFILSAFFCTCMEKKGDHRSVALLDV